MVRLSLQSEKKKELASGTLCNAKSTNSHLGVGFFRSLGIFSGFLKKATDRCGGRGGPGGGYI